MPYAVLKNEFIAYTGSNSAAIVAFGQHDSERTWTKASEAGQVLTLSGQGSEGPPLERVMHVGDVAVLFSSTNLVFMSAAELTQSYIEVLTADLVGVQAVSAGYTTTPSILVGAQATIAVQLTPAQPSTSYHVPKPQLSGSAQLLGALSVESWAIVDADTVNVVVKNNGLLALAGATVLVTAVS